MICRNIINRYDYNYKFIEDGLVELSNINMEKPIYVKYEDWCMDYYVIDKWNDLR